MAAYQTQQVNVGSIAAPDVGSVFTSFADRINKQQSNQLDNMRQAAQFDRQQVLNQRADQLWNRQQGVLQASKDIAKELIDTPYSAKFGGTEAMAKVDEDVRKEAQRRLDAGEAPFSAEEAAGIQKTYEANRPYKEDAIRNIAGRLMAQGATAQEANAEAEGLTKGLISRADEQAYLDQNRKILQEQYDNVAKANLEALKANIDIGKSNQTNDYHKAQLQQQANQLLYGNPTGGGSGGGKGGITAGGAGGISQILQGVGAFDAKDAQEQIKSYYDKGYTDQQIFNVIKNAVDTDPSAWLVHDNKIDFNAVDRMLSKQTPGMSPYTSTANIRDVNTGGINAADLMAKIAPYQRAGYNPDRMEALLRSNVPSIFKGDATQQSSSVDPSTSGVNTTKTVKAVNHINNVPDSLLINEGAKVSQDGLYRPSADVDSTGQARGRMVGYGYNLDQNKGNIQTDFDRAGIPEYKREAALNGKDFALTKPEVDKLAEVVYKREGIDKAGKLVDGYSKLDPMMKEIANDMAYRGDLIPGDKGYRGDLVKVLNTGDINKVYDYVNTMNVPQEVKTRLGNILTTERSREEILGKDAKPSRLDSATIENNKKMSNMYMNGSSEDIQSKINELMDKGQTLTKIISKGRQDSDTVDDLAATNRQIQALKEVLNDRETSKNKFTPKNYPDVDKQTAYRNYLLAKRTGQPYSGMTEDEWYSLSK